MMNNINEIMDMLDWNNDLETQENGRILAGEVQCLKIFMQPCDRKYNKNVWENCALVISNKSDRLLQPYLLDMLDWLQDINWPGAFIIVERLKKFQNYEILAFAISEKVKVAKATADSLWLLGMSELLGQKRLLKYLADDIIFALNNCRKN